MLVLRCTQKLLTRLGPPDDDPPMSTTVLGDWYAKPFGVAQRRFVLLISGNTRIAQILPGRDVATIPERFPEILAILLANLRIPREAIDREVAACRDVVIARTDSRSLLGTLNDFAHMAKWRLQDRPEPDLDAESLALSHTPVGSLGYAYPADLARQAFGLKPFRSVPPEPAD